MSTDSPMIRDGSNVTASANLSAKQFYAVALSGSGTVDLASTGGKAYGILQNKPTSGQAADVCIFGVCKALAGSGGWTAGNSLKVDASGSLIATSSGDANVVAVAIETASVGDIARVKVIPTAG